MVETCWEKNNDYIVKKMGEIKIEGNRWRGRPKKKLMGVIREDVTAYELKKFQKNEGKTN